MLNGVPVQSLKGLATPLAAGDTLAVFPIIGGGMRPGILAARPAFCYLKR